ncbi:tyrosine-type recombinase/integrase [Saccharopolyspora elongata]|uniref:Site-specific integrase n=1 Tax=Saccharopolyspora elongata TaxID=2530387 RepID=A0A4R4YRV5_9PSEU|nr:site-specific integrase [Saccharopolyspora elongata]TDD47946.1 site-specific integrase [Saccharopolyspora elongata]
MTRAEVARFREVAAEDSEQIDLLIDIGTETGLRWGELAGLHLERVDTKRLVIQVQEVWDKHSNEIKPYPKGRRRRGVPITRRLAGRIDDYVERNPPKRCRARHRGGGRCTGALLLASKAGTPLNYGNVRRQHRDSVAEGAGLAGVTPHDMRHTYASWLIQDGAGIETVSALLGHKSWTTTMRYAHLADARWAQVRDIIGGPEPTSGGLSSDSIAAAVRALAEAEPERWAAVAAALDGEQDPISAPFGGNRRERQDHRSGVPPQISRLIWLAPPAGFEPATPALEDLAYGPFRTVADFPCGLNGSRLRTLAVQRRLRTFPVDSWG